MLVDVPYGSQNHWALTNDENEEQDRRCQGVKEEWYRRYHGGNEE